MRALIIVVSLLLLGGWLSVGWAQPEQACPKYQHMAIAASGATCADDLHTLTEAEWQLFNDRLSLLEGEFQNLIKNPKSVLPEDEQCMDSRGSLWPCQGEPRPKLIKRPQP